MQEKLQASMALISELSGRNHLRACGGGRVGRLQMGRSGLSAFNELLAVPLFPGARSWIGLCWWPMLLLCVKADPGSILWIIRTQSLGST